MFQSYVETELEIWMKKLYLDNGINTPLDLSIENVANKLNVHVEYMEGAREVAVYDEDAAVIFLNPNKPEAEVRKIFFHELCHPLRHHGDQVGSIDTFITLQERQANQFMLYASMPFFMVKLLELPQFDYQWAPFLAFVFHVPLNLAQRRVDQIKRRVQQAELDNEFVKQQSNYKKSYDPANWSPETKAIMDQLYSQLKGAIS